MNGLPPGLPPMRGDAPPGDLHGVAPVATPDATGPAPLIGALADALGGLALDQFGPILESLQNAYGTLEAVHRLAVENRERQQNIETLLQQLYTSVLALTAGARHQQIIDQLVAIEDLRGRLVTADEQIHRLNDIATQLDALHGAVAAVNEATIRASFTSVLDALAGAYRQLQQVEIQRQISGQLEQLVEHMRALGHVELATRLNNLATRYAEVHNAPVAIEGIDALFGDAAANLDDDGVAPMFRIRPILEQLQHAVEEVRIIEETRTRTHATLQDGLGAIADAFMRITNATRATEMATILEQIEQAYGAIDGELKLSNLAETLTSLATLFDTAHTTNLLRLTRDGVVAELSLIDRLAKFNNAEILDQLDRVRDAVGALPAAAAAAVALRAAIERQSDIGVQLGGINAIYEQIHGFNPVPANVLVELAEFERLYSEIVGTHFADHLATVEVIYRELVDTTRTEATRQQGIDALATIQQLFGELSAKRLLANMGEILDTFARGFMLLDPTTVRNLLTQQIGDLLAELGRQRDLLGGGDLAARIAEIEALRADLGRAADRDDLMRIFDRLRAIYVDMGGSVPLLVAAILNTIHEIRIVLEFRTPLAIVSALDQIRQQFTGLRPVTVQAELESVLVELQTHFATLQANSGRFVLAEQLAQIQSAYNLLSDTRSRLVMNLDDIAVLREQLLYVAGGGVQAQIAGVLGQLHSLVSNPTLMAARIWGAMFVGLPPAVPAAAPVAAPVAIAALLQLLQQQFTTLGVTPHQQIVDALAAIQTNFAALASPTAVATQLAALQAQYAALPQTGLDRIAALLGALQMQFAALALTTTPQTQIAATLGTIQQQFGQLGIAATPQGQIAAALAMIQQNFTTLGAPAVAAVAALAGPVAAAALPPQAALMQQIRQLGKPLVSSTSFYAVLGDKTLEFTMSEAADQQRAEKGYANEGDDVKLLESLGILAPGPGPKEFHGAFAHLKALMPDFFKGIRDKCYSPLALLTSAECESAAYVVRTVLERVHMGLRKRLEAARALGTATAADARAIASAQALLARVGP